ncbi:MAG: PH domain-containing protein [Clostridia bacterium]|nr:PH domain-containing protein [Clostridia bacterium]MBQ5956642.1 PH domain-containing protein [Clostridia bacterium]
MSKKNKAIFQETEQPEILWKDRKRWLGMPLTFTKYSVDENRLYVKIGLLRSEENELLLYRVLDIKVSKTLGQKIFGVGTVTLYTADQSNHTIALKNIKYPDKVKRFISDLVESERKELGLTGSELFGTGTRFQEHNEDCEHPAPPHGPKPPVPPMK